MSWNYRVFKTQYRIRLTRGKEDFIEEYFTIREVYYDDEENITGISGGDCGVHPSGNTSDELWKDLEKMKIAFQKPILSPRRHFRIHL